MRIFWAGVVGLVVLLTMGQAWGQEPAAGKAIMWGAVNNRSYWRQYYVSDGTGGEEGGRRSEKVKLMSGKGGGAVAGDGDGDAADGMDGNGVR